MSNAVFPSLVGLDIAVKWKPNFMTLSQQAASGMEQRIQLRQYPIYDIELKFEVLRSDSVNVELQNLLGFFMLRSGSGDSFLFTHPEDNSVTAQGIGVGNGTNTVFQLARSYGGFVEPVMNPNAITAVYVNGVSAPFTLGALGVVTMTTAPAAAAVVTWTGTYYYRCRFVDDNIEPERFSGLMWEVTKVRLVGSLGNKIP